MPGNDPLANSTLKCTIFLLNPSLDRQTQAHISKLNKLALKEKRSSEYKQQTFKSTFESRRNKRKKLFETIKPKLDSSSRNAIERFKREHRKELKPKKSPKVEKTLVDKKAEAKVETASEEEQDSKRSSLKSSLLSEEQPTSGCPGQASTEIPLSSVEGTEKKKPEVIVTKATQYTKEKSDEKIESEDNQNSENEKESKMQVQAGFPTALRAVGKVRRSSVVNEKDTAKENEPKGKSTAGFPTALRTVGKVKAGDFARKLKRDSEAQDGMDVRSPIAQEGSSVVNDQDQAIENGVKGKTTAGFPTALRTVGKVKAGDFARKFKRDSEVQETTDGKSQAGIAPSIRKLSGANLPKKDQRKPSTSLAGIKGFLGSKKKKEESSLPQDHSERWQYNKDRLFFTERAELSDDEVLSNIGKESVLKEVGQGLNEIVQAANVMKKYMKDRVVEKPNEDSTPQDAIGPGLPTSIMYVGALKARLAAKHTNQNEEDEERKLLDKTDITVSTRFLGKMMSRKDKYGLYTGCHGSTEDLDGKENPVILALEKIKLKPHHSVDSGDSRPGSRASHTSKKSNLSLARESEDMLGDLGTGEVLGILHRGLTSVRPAVIGEWNLHKHVRGDRSLRPIFIPF